MNLALEEIGQVRIVTPPGEELDANVASDFKEAMAPILIDSSRIVLDLSHLRFVDSSGLGAILTCTRSSKDAGGELVLCGMQPSVKSLFQMINADRFCRIVP